MVADDIHFATKQAGQILLEIELLGKSIKSGLSPEDRHHIHITGIIVLTARDGTENPQVRRAMLRRQGENGIPVL